MARQANTAKTLQITADCLHVYDYVVGTDGDHLLVTERPTKRKGTVTVTVDRRGGEYNAKAFTVDVARLVTVAAEHGCQCDGSGIFRGGGRVENGVYKGYEGTCYGCGGKGWQDRADVIRNHVYWAKYARIGWAA